MPLDNIDYNVDWYMREPLQTWRPGTWGYLQ